MKALVPAALGLLCSISAHAAQVPQPAGNDPHVRVAIYRPSEQVLLVGAVGRSMMLTFGADETITRVVFEDPPVSTGKTDGAPWQSAGATADLEKNPLGNVLPVWAMRAGRSSLQVSTRTGTGANRVYLFQLIALPPQPDECATDDCDDPRITVGLSFVYPAQAKQAAAKDRQAAQQLAAEDRLRTDIFYGARNWKYIEKGKTAALRDIGPDAVSDNTQATGLLYLGNRKIPALYIVEADGSERQVTPTPDQDLLVVYETAPHWRLRKDGEVIDLHNLGYDAIGTNPWTGTTSPSVIRVTRSVTK
jgi:type IV secretion system protein VirB9